MQTAAEYRAIAVQTYNMAERNMDAAVEDRGWTAAVEQGGNYASLPPAVVMDVDETVLDNSKYQAKLVLEGKEFNARTWDEWIARKEAEAVPGAVDFIDRVREKGVGIIFITNRECRKRDGSDATCPQEQDTIDNLERAGIGGVGPEDILLRNEEDGWSSEKKTRREQVSRKYRIVMLFGDDLGDCLPDVKTGISPRERDELVKEHGEDWGRRWYVLPNPTYGSWLGVLDGTGANSLTGY